MLNVLWRAMESARSLLLCWWSLSSAQMCTATLTLYWSLLALHVLFVMKEAHESLLPVYWEWRPDRTQAEKGSLAIPRILELCPVPFKNAFSLKEVLAAFCSLILPRPLCVSYTVCDHRRTSQLCVRAGGELPRGDDISFFYKDSQLVSSKHTMLLFQIHIN